MSDAIKDALVARGYPNTKLGLEQFQTDNGILLKRNLNTRKVNTLMALGLNNVIDEHF